MSGREKNSSYIKRVALTAYVTATGNSWFFIHVRLDDIVPFWQSINAYKLLKHHVIPAEIRLLDKVDHNFKYRFSNEFDEFDVFLIRYKRCDKQ